MTNIIRSAKSGSDWTNNEPLDAYNIKITFQDAQTFFGEAALPPPAVDQEVLTALTADDAVNDATYDLLTQLDIAMQPSESAVDDFVVALFHSLGYLRRPRAIRTHKELQFIVCGEKKYAKLDVCIIDRSVNDIVLLVHEDNRFGGDINPHAQLTAEALAAFQNNNARRRLAGLDAWDSKVWYPISNLEIAHQFISYHRSSLV